jgi:hypothetical protein
MMDHLEFYLALHSRFEIGLLIVTIVGLGIMLYFLFQKPT